MPDSPSYVVTGGAHGVGRAILDRLAHSGHAVVIDVAEEPDRRDERVSLITGDARDSDVAVKAARTAEGSGVLCGWVNNAAVFSNATLDLASPSEIPKPFDSEYPPGGGVTQLRGESRVSCGRHPSTLAHAGS